MFLRRPSAPAKFSRESRSVYQERPWRIFEPGIREHERPRLIGLFALIEPAHLTTPFLVLRKGVGDMHLRPDPRQREKSGSGFPVQPNAAMRVRNRMNKTFME